jgi:hypothetical protein
VKRADLKPGMDVAWQRSVQYDAPLKATVVRIGVSKYGGYRRSETLVDVVAGDRTYAVSESLLQFGPLVLVQVEGHNGFRAVTLASLRGPWAEVKAAYDVVEEKRIKRMHAGRAAREAVLARRNAYAARLTELSIPVAQSTHDTSIDLDLDTVELILNRLDSQ